MLHDFPDECSKFLNNMSENHEVLNDLRSFLGFLLLFLSCGDWHWGIIHDAHTVAVVGELLGGVAVHLQVPDGDGFAEGEDSIDDVWKSILVDEIGSHVGALEVLLSQYQAVPSVGARGKPVVVFRHVVGHFAQIFQSNREIKFWLDIDRLWEYAQRLPLFDANDF